MSGTANKTISAQFEGMGVSTPINVSYDTAIKSPAVALPCGKVATSWVKTDGTTAAANLPSGHGYTTGVFDVYWVAGGVTYVHYSVPGTITTNAIAFSGGSGTDFPATATTGIVVCKQVEIDATVPYAKIQYCGVVLKNAADPTSKGHVDMQSSAPASVFAAILSTEKTAGGADNIKAVAAGEANPLSGNVAKIYLSNGSSTQDATADVFFGVSAT